MKKLLYAVICLLLLPINICGKTISLDEINLKLDFNDEYYVITRYNLTNNEDLELFGYTEQEMKYYLENHNKYLIAATNKLDIIYLLESAPYEKTNNLSNYDDEYIEKLAKSFNEKLSGYYYQIYNNEKNKYVMVKYYNEDIKTFNTLYITVVNARLYGFTAAKYSKLDDIEEKEFKDLIDSVTINVLDEYKNENSNNDFDSHFKDMITWVIISFAILVFKAVRVTVRDNRRRAENEKNDDYKMYP